MCLFNYTLKPFRKSLLFTGSILRGQDKRTQQYASVMPILDSYNTSILADGTPGYAFVIINNGLGPAFIEEATFYYGGKKYHSVGKFKALLLEQSQIIDSTSRVSDLWRGRVIGQGEHFSLIESKNKAVEEALRNNLDKARVQILYKSVYGETWLHTYGGDENSERNVKLE